MINSDNFIFHSDLVPFTITQVIELSIPSGTTIAANQKKTVYSDWKDVYGSKIGFQTVFSVDDQSSLDWMEYSLKDVSSSQTAVRGTPRAEYSAGKVRMALDLQNFTNSAQTFTEKTFYGKIHIIKLNNV